MAAAGYIRTATGIIPADDDARKTLDRYKTGEMVFLSHASQRSARQSSYFHALCKTVYDNTSYFDSVEDVKVSAKMYCGHVLTTHVKWEGEWFVRKTARSITEFDHDGFHEFVQRSLDYFAIELGVPVELLDAETRNYGSGG